MRAPIILFFVIIFVSTQLANAGFRGRSNYSYKDGISSKSSSKSNFMMSDDSQINTRTNVKSQKNTPTESTGKKIARTPIISAWGIIAIVLAAILIATTGYYAFVFYPFLCKKERNYDMIELTNVV